MSMLRQRSRRAEEGGRGFKSRHLHDPLMTSVRILDSAQAQEIEEQLFTTHRQQLPRHVPIPLPRQDFWEMVRALLSKLDLEIQEMVRKGSIDMRLQNLQKRQTNIRRIASELARKRMVAMMQHAASQSLRSGGQPGVVQELPSLEWQRHDPAEKAFYHALQLNVDRFKKEIDWQGMQQGILSELRGPASAYAPGTMQLDDYMGEGERLSARPPPDLAFEDELPQLPDMQDDEEERLLAEPDWADEEAYLMADIQEPAGNTPVEAQPTATSKHGAAMELAPSSKPFEQISDEPPLPLPEVEEQEKVTPAESTSEQQKENVRVRILETLGEPIIDDQGEELSLEAGDIHFLDEETAAWLVDVGVAERAEL